MLVAVARDKAVFDIGGRQETLPLLEKDVGRAGARWPARTSPVEGSGAPRAPGPSSGRGPRSPAGPPQAVLRPRPRRPTSSGR